MRNISQHGAMSCPGLSVSAGADVRKFPVGSIQYIASLEFGAMLCYGDPDSTSETSLGLQEGSGGLPPQFAQLGNESPSLINCSCGLKTKPIPEERFVSCIYLFLCHSLGSQEVRLATNILFS
jgi:hypothetical protein